ncbi:MAG: alpha/beta hydrolase [Acidimicrobiales bacterium]|jgi:pimeloyl-ACP methyl ester carboxylesterase
MTERPAAPSGYEWHDLATVGPRSLEILTGGPSDGFPLVFHSGTPSGAAPFPVVVQAAADRGFRTITYSRPGYGTSSSVPGRKAGDAAGDVADILDLLGYGPFVTFGWSGGGPHTLACAGLLGDRCVAAGVLAGVAPHDADGLDWPDGMSDENLLEFDLARQGGPEFEGFLQVVAEALAELSNPASIAEALGNLVTDRDKDVIMSSGVGEYMSDAMSQAVLEGTDGWRDDDVAFLTHWGFDPSVIDRPVRIWHGTEDRMVPVNHGRWLAAHVPGAHIEIIEGEGHVSLLPVAIPPLLDHLAAAADLG